ncbi:MAG TPA: 4'-phosphopantetheinyl transferase superfamily protein [Cellvibrio sp.]|nr:4'-phosphopantetheinyl transferase superfamily protein [Cellvibrio sp.]
MQSFVQTPEQLFISHPVFVQSTRMLADVYGLYPEERLLIANAIPKRRAEFCAGRHCARQALANIGKTASPILADVNGCPVWPDSIVGSISHTKNYAIAAIAWAVDLCAIGIDIELWKDSSVDWCSIKKICSSAEKNWVDALPGHDQKLAAHLIFSARESIYKCIYSATGVKLGANQVVVKPSSDRSVFSANISLANLSCDLEGSFGFNDDYVFSAVWMPTLPP